MVVFATPEVRDISSMVRSSNPASVSRSSVVVRTRSRETSTRGSRDSSREGTVGSSVVLALATELRPFGIDITLRYGIVALRTIPHTNGGPRHGLRIDPHDQRRPRAGGSLLRAGHRGPGHMAGPRLRRGAPAVLHDRLWPHPDGPAVQQFGPS